ncbi:membrane protease subunit HflK [Oleiphilus messinensis]|uniref:Protein HflK n=1 Tax=Oleiphilus messinensis TaxID=141451 RepID=A0A1Y0I6U2_9GAMM|nr:FtsH protease activity modulator HflK [Oleiphilus messinensis]ARU55909.1 membrane protease subunit HflK [Oleiphilus messinensis]
MAWNEPGGNRNDQDPWGGGNRGGDQGPPDIDEALKKGMEKLNSLFGGGRGSNSSRSNGSGGGGAAAGGIFVLLLLVFVIVAVFQSVYTVNERERAVVLRFGKYSDTIGPGLQFKIPFIDKVQMVDVTRVRSANSQGHMLTEDENIVEVVLQVQYVVSDPRAFVLDIRDAERTLDYAIDSALRHEVGSSELNQVLTEGRSALAIRVQERLQQFLVNYKSGLSVSKVNIEDTYAPKEVQAAFRDVQSAIEDEQREINQAEQYKNKIVPEARGGAQRILEEASAYKEEVIAKAEGETTRFLKLLAVYEDAPEVTRERMYIDTLQKVMSKASKVVVDVQGGNNMMYLPLDKLLERAPASLNVPSFRSDASSVDIQALADRVLEELRSRPTTTTSRRGR